MGLKANKPSTLPPGEPGTLETAADAPSGLLARWDRTVYARVACLMLVLLALICAVSQHLGGAVLPYDDAFITFRYVDNFVNGHGLVYNQGDPTWGYSTVLYVFWLAGLKCLFSSVSIPELAVRGNLVPFLAAGFAIFLLIRTITRSNLISAVAMAAVLCHPAMLAISLGGMESFLFLALLLLAVLAMLKNRTVTAGVLMGLTMITRPEAVILVPTAIIIYWKRWKSLALLAGIAAVLPVAWSIFAMSYYGSIIPLSVIAKNKPLYPLAAGEALHNLVLGLEGAFFAGGAAGLREMRSTLALDIVLASALAALAYRPYRKAGAWVAPLFFCLLMAMYYKGNPMVFEWYWPAVFVSGLLSILTGIPAAAALLEGYPARTAHVRLGRVLPTALLVAGAAWLLVVTLVGYGEERPGFNVSVTKFAADPARLRVNAYQKAALAVNAAAKPSDRVAAPEIGSLGYYLNCKVLDACGLVSREALPYLPAPEEQRAWAGCGVITNEFVRDTKPEWVVLLPLFGIKSILVDTGIAKEYEVVGQIPLEKRCMDSDQVWILRRR